MELECHALDLCDCIESAFDLVVIKAGEKGLELIHDFGPRKSDKSLVDESSFVNGTAFVDETPQAILGDVTRLRQVLTNLLTNAVKFTERGEIVLSVTARRLPEPEGASMNSIFR
jgi:signal transduction histidine kinase